MPCAHCCSAACHRAKQQTAGHAQFPAQPSAIQSREACGSASFPATRCVCRWVAFKAAGGAAAATRPLGVAERHGRRSCCGHSSVPGSHATCGQPRLGCRRREGILSCVNDFLFWLAALQKLCNAVHPLQLRITSGCCIRMLQTLTLQSDNSKCCCIVEHEVSP